LGRNKPQFNSHFRFFVYELGLDTIHTISWEISPVFGLDRGAALMFEYDVTLTVISVALRRWAKLFPAMSGKTGKSIQTESYRTQAHRKKTRGKTKLRRDKFL